MDEQEYDLTVPVEQLYPVGIDDCLIVKETQ
jgi:hypothetical protein